jgi:hypothetical protein
VRDKGFLWVKGKNHVHARVPYWSVVLFSSILFAISWYTWLPFRFSIRTMLMVTTLAAILLGAIVWIAHR